MSRTSKAKKWNKKWKVSFKFYKNFPGRVGGQRKKRPKNSKKHWK